MTSTVLDRARAVPFAEQLANDVRARWVAGAAAFAVLGLASSQDSEGVVLCPFRRCTGGYCPGCGMTRATGALLRGGVTASWRQHPFLVLALAQLVVLSAWMVVGGERARNHLRGWQSQLLLANAVALLAIWVVRLSIGSIPVPFG